ncbi:NAD(P)-dependent alcohol dehydrogenase [Nibrella viscosa]|uniref:NAD(P)-dependent alcohol dehydrogenase n=1 Tax=Nibrella viscosa TaxID=1084524 RepID=A0ABP8KXQ7_9BACT
MKAVVINQNGDSSVLQLQDVPQPVPDHHDVLIRVYATSINPLDWKLRAGFSKWLPGKFPRILGAECAGEVVATGLMVTDFRPGDRVVAELGLDGGGYAEYALAHQKNVVKLPDDLDYVPAAAIPIAGLTALQALRDLGHLRPGDQVLINGAAGGVGTFAVQIACILGGRVTAVCSDRHTDLVRRLGAGRVIDYRKEDFTQLPDRYKIIFDTVSKRSFSECKKVLTDDGIYIATVPSAAQLFQDVVTTFTNQKTDTIAMKFSKDDMHWLLTLVAAGRLEPVIEHVYLLPEIAKAHQHSEAGHATGKLVVAINHSDEEK